MSSNYDHLRLGQSVAIDLSSALESIESLSNDNNLRQTMSVNSRAEAVSRYDYPVVTAQYEELWMELASIARRLPNHVPPSLDKSDYFRCFSHYASTIINDDTPLVPTTRGMQQLEAGIMFPPLPGFLSSLPILDAFLIKTTLACLTSAQANDHGVSSTFEAQKTGDLVKVVSKQTGAPIEHIRHCIMWLFKYGLVKGVVEN